MIEPSFIPSCNLDFLLAGKSSLVLSFQPGVQGLNQRDLPQRGEQTISYQGVWVGEESKLDILTSEIRIGSLANCPQSEKGRAQRR